MKNEKEKVTCRKCKQECKPMIDCNPTWYGRYKNDQLTEAICAECWGKGEKWEKK
jgi:hypothetical protein